MELLRLIFNPVLWLNCSTKPTKKQRRKAIIMQTIYTYLSYEINCEIIKNTIDKLKRLIIK